MTSIAIDLTDGLSSSTAYKGPCRAATAANIVLSGQQTIDGVAVVADDRVLVKNQTTASENGIYVADTGAWRRSKDFSGNRDVKKGTLVSVTDGTGVGGYQVTTSNPITIGTSNIVFVQQLAGATLGSGVGAFLATPTSANLKAALTDETGSGAAVFATSPELTTPTITTRIEPTTDDGAPLGSTAKKWSDLFLASGGVINFNSGDVTVTHVANQLQFAGGASGYVFDAVVAPSSNDAAPLGTGSFSWSDLFLASGAVLNFANGNYTVTHSSGTLTFSGAVVLGQDPVSALQAVTKQYVDNLAAGLDVKASARVATTANITLTAPQTIDGISAIAGDRVVVKNQSAPAENGIYLVAAGAWTRATDMDAWTEVPGANVWVEEGTVNGDTAWVCTANAGGTIGVTSITWTQFGGTGAYQPTNANLTSWAAITRASGFDAFVAGGTSAQLIALMTDETGTGSLVFGTSPTFTTQITAPKAIGGTGTGSSLSLQSTSGVGATDFINFLVGNAGATESARFTTSGQFLFGSTVSYATFGGAVTPQFQMHGTTGNQVAQGIYNWGNTAGGANQIYSKSRSGTIGTRGIVSSGDSLASLIFTADDGVNFIEAARIQGLVDGTPGVNDMPGRLEFSTTADGAAAITLRLKIDNTGFTSVVGGSFGRGAPVTKTADFTVATTENWLINNKAAATCTVTLPAAASFTGREIMINNYQAFTVVSASANVVPQVGTAAATAILAATAGKWATLVSNGTNWVITQSN